MGLSRAVVGRTEGKWALVRALALYSTTVTDAIYLRLSQQREQHRGCELVAIYGVGQEH